MEQFKKLLKKQNKLNEDVNDIMLNLTKQVEQEGDENNFELYNSEFNKKLKIWH